MSHGGDHMFIQVIAVHVLHLVNVLASNCMPSEQLFIH